MQALPQYVHPGDTVTVTGVGFFLTSSNSYAMQNVQMLVNNTVIDDKQVVPNSSGNFTTTFVAPPFSGTGSNMTVNIFAYPDIPLGLLNSQSSSFYVFPAGTPLGGGGGKLDLTPLLLLVGVGIGAFLLLKGRR